MLNTLKVQTKKNNTMKKIIFTVIVLFAIGWTNMGRAQDCRAIVRPFYIQMQIDSTTYPAEKEAYFCHISQNMFFITEQVPSGSTVYNLSELTNTLTNQKVDQNYEIDLNTLSYWGYDFYRFRPQGKGEIVYFRLGKRSDHRYLAMRPYQEAQARVDYPELYQK